MAHCLNFHRATVASSAPSTSRQKTWPRIKTACTANRLACALVCMLAMSFQKATMSLAIASTSQAVCRPWHQPGGFFCQNQWPICALRNCRTGWSVKGSIALKNIAKPVEVMSVQLLSAAERPHQHEDLTEPDIRLCKAPDGTRLAWTRNGNGPKLVKVANWISHLELDWRNPGTGHLLSSLGQAFEVIRYDSRGNGMSDWDSKDISFDRFVDDLEAIFDESSIDRAPLLALSQGCAVAVAFAARHPERVSGIAMIGGFPARSGKTEIGQRSGARKSHSKHDDSGMGR
jgi:hypothetical protein